MEERHLHQNFCATQMWQVPDSEADIETHVDVNKTLKKNFCLDAILKINACMDTPF